MKESGNTLSKVIGRTVDAGAGAAAEALCGGEVVGKLHFPAYVEVPATEKIAHIVPELGFGGEDNLGSFRQHFAVAVVEEQVLLPPEIRKAGEAQALESEKVPGSPYQGELERKLAVVIGIAIGDILI